MSAGVRRRVERARAVLDRPGDLVLFGRMLAWALALPALKRAYPLPRLVELAAPRARPSGPRAASVQTVVTLARWVYRLPGLRDNCLERSILTYRYLPEAGRRYRLLLGVRRGHPGPPGHAWLTVDDFPVHDSDETLAGLVPVVAFDGAGRREELSLADPVRPGSEGAALAARPHDGDERRAGPEQDEEGSPGPG